MSSEPGRQRWHCRLEVRAGAWISNASLAQGVTDEQVRSLLGVGGSAWNWVLLQGELMVLHTGWLSVSWYWFKASKHG